MSGITKKGFTGILGIFSCILLNGQISYSTGGQFKYLKGSEAGSIATNWNSPAFDASTWHTGNAPIRYGDGTGGTELTDMQNTYSTVYMRSTFTVANAANIQTISASINYDDGFIVWINGYEVLKQNAPADPSYNSFAPGNHESGAFENFTIYAADAHLVDGTNTLAIQGFNVSLTSSDFYMDLSLDAIAEQAVLKDSLGISFSQKSGFYGSPFDITISTPDPAAGIIYTLDGSNPQESLTAYTSSSPATVHIDPQSTTGRAATPAVVVRASLSKSGYTPSFPVSRTYIFPDRVKTQGYPGGDWPSSDVNGQIIDLAMDSRVINDSRYTSKMTSSLESLPVISIITDLKNLFDPASGIYVNADGHSLDWERECSVELFNTDGTPGFNTDAGLRIRGGWSRHDNFPKHALRLFFRDQYGDGKLDYPLFEDEGANEFDKVDLRCEENYAWSNGDGRNSLVREVFSRDSQRDMGEPYTRSRYYNLYLDGMYWGIYQTQERSEASYAAEYLGGSRDDYDVVKVNTENYVYQIEATDGNLNAWQELYNQCSSGFTDNAKYFKLEGKDAYGNPVFHADHLVDIDNLIDYMLTIFYAGNFDAPTSAFGNNKGPNNFYAVYNRVDKSRGFVFFNHDAEHALMVDAAPPGIGLYEDRVNIGDRTDDLQMQVNSFGSFHPQWLHYKLTQNAEYRLRFADRAYKFLTNGGALTSDVAEARFNERVDEVEPAIISESARWGDAGSANPYTKDDNWLPVINQVRNDFFPERTSIVLSQLKDAGLYPSVNPPVISNSGQKIYVSRMDFKSALTLTFSNPNSGGKLYYTLSNQDPRLVGGAVSTWATEATSATQLSIESTTIIKARVLNNGTWSALRELDILAQQEDYSNFKITEVNYHPTHQVVGTDSISDKSLEFIEFKNIGGTSINLSGVVIDSAVHYTFPDNTILPPKQFYVIASKPSKFYEFYGMAPYGNFQGNLSNSGEEILVQAPGGATIMDFHYQEGYPWPVEADGYGKTLVPTDPNPTGDPADPAYWKASVRTNGSPFHDDGIYNDIIQPITGNSGGAILSVYPNPTSDMLNIVYPEFDGQPFKIAVSLYDINGELIYRSNGDNGISIKMNHLNIPSGMYFLKVTTSSDVKTVKILYNKL